MRRYELLRFLAAAISTALVACNDEPLSSPATGSIEITTVTAGSPGSGTYTIRVGEDAEQPIGPNATLRIAELAPGEHRVALGGLVEPCVVDEANPRAVSVVAGETIAVEFRVRCTAEGSLALVTRTTGESLDRDGYLLRIDGGPAQRVESNGTTRIGQLTPKLYFVRIDDLAPNCTLSGGSTRSVTVVDRDETEVVFEVACTFQGAVRWDSILLPASLTTGFSHGKTLWGTSPSNLYVVAMEDQRPGGSAILHYDGSHWKEQARYPETSLTAITGVSANEIYAIGSTGIPGRGLLLHYDGTRWSEIAGFAADPSRIGYTDIWTAPSGEVLLVGAVDGIMVAARRDGMTWSEVATPARVPWSRVGRASGTSLTDLWAIDWAYNCDECYSVSSFVGHWDGAQSSIVHREMYSFFVDVLALAPDDVWVVGADYGYDGRARVAHWDGVSWTSGPPIPEDEYQAPLWAVWGSSSSDIYATGEQVLLRYDGTRWHVVPGLGGHTVWGLSRDDVFLIYHDYNADRDVLVHGRPH